MALMHLPFDATAGPDTEVLRTEVALGRTTVVIPESAGVDLRRDLAAVPAVDAPAVTTVIAWPPLSRYRAVADFIRVATTL